MTPSAEIDTAYPLTPMQELMLGHSIGAPDSDACFVQYTLRVTGPFDAERYRSAWQQLADRHPALRTCFAWRGLDEPLQVVLAAAEVPLAVLDLAADAVTAPGGLSTRLSAIAAEQSRQGFTLTRPPLLRLVVLRVAPEDHYVLVCMHHLIVDGWSAELLLREAGERYRSPAIDDRKARGFGAYVAWLRGRDQVQAACFWKAALAGLGPGCGRPGALLRPVNNDRGTLQEIRQGLNRETVAGLRARARDARVTVSTLVHAVWGLLLARYSGQRDVVFAVTVAGRPLELDGVEEIVGPFINNVPVVVTDPGDAPLDAWLAALQERHARAEPYQWCSPAEIQRWSDAPPARPLYETLLVFQNYPGRYELSPLGERTRVVRHVSDSPTIRTGFPLTLTVTLSSEDAVLRTTHDSAVVSRPGMERLHEDVAAILAALSRGAQVAEELPLPAPWTAPATDLPRPRMAAVPYVAPRTPLEQRIAELLAEALDVDEMGVHDDFFDAGGNSVAAIHLTRRLSAMLRVDLPVATVFENPNVADLATVILADALRRADAAPSDAARSSYLPE